MSTIFWDSQAPILETYMESGTTATSATYCDVFQSGLKPAIRSKRIERLSERVPLLHDNARPRTAALTLVCGMPVSHLGQITLRSEQCCI
jgi:hypothetical protein